MNEALENLTTRLLQWAEDAKQALSSGTPDPKLGANLKPLLEELHSTLQVAHEQTAAKIEAVVAESKERAAARQAASAARAAARAERAAGQEETPPAPFGTGRQFLDDDNVRLAIRELLEQAPAHLPADGDDVWQMQSTDWQVSKERPPRPKPPKPRTHRDTKQQPGDKKDDVWDVESTDWSAEG
ncbi:MAG: hypothetical protein AB7K24_11680 [Gemmataceae bacterium]